MSLIKRIKRANYYGRQWFHITFNETHPIYGDSASFGIDEFDLVIESSGFTVNPDTEDNERIIHRLKDENNAIKFNLL